MEEMELLRICATRLGGMLLNHSLTSTFSFVAILIYGTEPFEGIRGTIYFEFGRCFRGWG